MSFHARSTARRSPTSAPAHAAPRTARPARAALVASAATLALGASLLAAPHAGAQTVPAQKLAEYETDGDFSGANAFYLPPADIPAEPGQLIKHEPMDLNFTVPNFDGPFPGKGTRFMYTTVDSRGETVAVTGMTMEPIKEWTGGGTRPTVVIGSGTIGQGDQCAPSRLAPTLAALDMEKPSLGLNYELMFANIMLREGVRVVMTDYVGLGTPGTHTYMNRVDQGHALIDAARAIPQLTGEETPVGFWGYSQGGGAAASAAELAGTYAPELDVRGTYAGAPPADLAQVAGVVDKNLIVGVLGYTINGLLQSNPEIRPAIEDVVSPMGKEVLASTGTQCIADSIVAYGALGATLPEPTTLLTRDGRTIQEHIRTNPELEAILEAQRIGTMRPNAPVLVANSRNDDAIPHGQAQQLAENWRALGADVEFRSVDLPPILPRSGAGHMVPMVTGFMDARDWLIAKFKGGPTPGPSGSADSSGMAPASAGELPVLPGTPEIRLPFN